MGFVVMAEEDDQKEEDSVPAEGADAGVDGGEEGAPSKGGGKKLVIFILLPILVLAGGGGGLYFTGMLDSLLGGGGAGTAEHGEEEGHGEAHGDDAEEAEADHGGGHGEANGEEKAYNPDAAFLEIPDMIVNLSTPDGAPRYLRLSVQLELATEKDLRKVEAVMPRVIDQFQTYLRELRVSDLRGSKGVYRLQMELLTRVNAAAYPVEVKDILFQEILIQ